MGRARARLVVLLVSLSGVTASCQGDPPLASPIIPTAACHAVSDVLAPRTDLAPLAGAFEVAFVTTTGPRAGMDPLVATLQLRAQDASLMTFEQEAGRTIHQPFIGSTNLDIAGLGAAVLGEATSVSPEQPGLAVYATRDAGGALVGLVMRIGSRSNVRGPLPIDGGHFTLFINRVVSDSFSGTWASDPGIGINAAVVRGHFCAQRIAVPCHLAPCMSG